MNTKRVKHLKLALFALLCAAAAAYLGIGRAQEPNKALTPAVPKTWDDQAIESLEIPRWPLSLLPAISYERNFDMRTAKSRAIIRHISVLSLLILLALAAPRCWHWTKAESATTTEGLPSLRGEEAITHLKEQGLYASLGEAVKAARYNAQPLPPDIVPLLAGSLQLKSGDGAAEDYFGAAVAISGNTAIVGAPRNDINGDADQGAAYIFVRSGRSWTQQAKLKAATGTVGDFFGGSVDISGDTAIVGAYLDDSIANVNQGAAYVFTRSAGVWTQQDKLKADDGGANDFFGFSVAIEDDTAIIGAHLNDTGLNANNTASTFTTPTRFTHCLR